MTKQKGREIRWIKSSNISQLAGGKDKNNCSKPPKEIIPVVKVLLQAVKEHRKAKHM